MPDQEKPQQTSRVSLTHELQWQEEQDNQLMNRNQTREKVEAFTRQMREAYLLLGEVLIPLLGNTPEDIQMLLELGEAYEALGCTREAIDAYELARKLAPECLPERARVLLETRQDQIP